VLSGRLREPLLHLLDEGGGRNGSHGAVSLTRTGLCTMQVHL
jgi:hypothetical protein